MYAAFRRRRDRGLPANGYWLRVQMRATVRRLYPNDPAVQKFKASRKFLMLFARRHNLSKRKKTNCKQLRYVTS